MAEETHAASSLAPLAESDSKPEDQQPEGNGKVMDATEKEHTPRVSEEAAMDTEDAKTNGKTEHNPNNSSDQATSSQQEVEDTEMQDAAEPDDAIGAEPGPAASIANGTPASSSKRASNGGSTKKKSSAVPEHRSKKLNKKKSKPMTNLNAQPGEYYFARMKGHPPWPSIICDEQMLPQSLLSSRPVTAALSDGSYKKPEYADGGKRAFERTFPVMFLYTNEFAWIPNTELSPLDPNSGAVQSPIEKGKSKTLLQAYSTAAEAHELAHFKEMLAEHLKALEVDQEEKAERAAKKAKKSARKSGDAAALADDADEMDIDEEVVSEKPKSKKRKKAEESDEANEKPAKTPKTATKLKLTTPKTPAAESSGKRKASKPKAKAQKDASEDDAVTPKAEEKPLTPGQAKEMKEKKVLYFRHKLQRGFLARDNAPKEDEMKVMSEFLTELESYPDLEGSIIRTTKIHKVLKNMIKLPSIPLDEVFNFKSRSMDLLSKWQKILTTEGGAGGEESRVDAPATTTNGETSKEQDEQAEQAEASEPAAPEEEKEEKLENKIGTTVEGDEETGEQEAQPEENAEEKKTDGPAIESAPGGEYEPEETVEATA